MQEKIILDTNFLIANLKWKIYAFRYFKGKKVYTISAVVGELKKLAIGKSQTAIFAKLALKQIKKKHLKVLKTNESADTSLLILSKQGYSIATQDKLLRQHIHNTRGKTILIRQKKLIFID